MKINCFFSKLYTLFNCVFLALFTFILLVVIFLNDNTFFVAKPLNLAICTILGVSVISGMYFILRAFQNFKLKYEIITVSLALFAFFVVQIVVGEMLLVEPGQGWDFGVVYSFAEQNVLHGTIPTEYFIYFSNNSALYLVFCEWFSLLKTIGFQDFLMPTVVLNVVFIDATLLLLYLTARHCFGKVSALLALALSFVTLPFITYVPIIYSDTLTLPFVILCALLWLHCKKAYENQNSAKAIMLAMVIALVAVAGSLLKPTVIIVLVAICIDALFTLSNAKDVKKYILIVVMVVLALIARTGMNWLVINDDRLPKFEQSQSIPFTHWVMMGLHDKGGYYDEDVQFTLNSGDYDERVKSNLSEIQNRVNAMGISGFIEHITQKLSFTYSDGLYFSSEKLNRSVIDISFLHNYVIYTSPGYGIVSYFAFGIMSGTFVFIWFGTFIAIKNKVNYITFCRVAIFGLTLYLMISETRSRYLVNFLPLFILLAVEQCSSINKLFKKQNINN